MAAQQQERRRIAREPHDEVDQQLPAAVLQHDRAADSNGALAASREAVPATLLGLREIARRLRPEELDELGLRGAQTALINRGWPDTTDGQWAEIAGVVRCARDASFALPLWDATLAASTNPERSHLEPSRVRPDLCLLFAHAHEGALPSSTSPTAT